MKAIRVVSFVALALLGVWQTAQAGGHDPSKFYVQMNGHHPQGDGSFSDNILTFNVPVQVPRAVLQPGTYRFIFVTPLLVRVTSLDEKTMYATFAIAPAVRLVPPGHGQARFQTMGDGQPIRLITWYLSGNATGVQPLYPAAHKAHNAAPLVAEASASN